jgi:DNA-binding CsgD family transcriptional regulator
MQKELALVKQTLEKLDQGVVVLTRDGRVALANARAIQWITKYFGSLSARGNRLPETLQRWVKHQEIFLEKIDGVPPPRKPLLVERDGKRLTVRFVSDSDQTLLLLEERLTSIEPAALESFGLSRREAEVLKWVSYGKTNVEIGMITAISPRTVQKHLEHIYQKLGVETRTGAAVRALSVINRN